MDEKGYKEITLSDEELGQFYVEMRSPIEILENQYLVIKDKDGIVIDKYKFQNGELKKVNFQIINSTYMGKIKPKNFEQELALDLLNSKDVTVKLIRGCYGSGKDFLMFGKALELIDAGAFKKIIYIRPNVTLKDVPDIGYLRGNEFDKLSWTLGPLYDKVGGKEEIDRLIEEERLELMPLLFIRGRSFESSIVYVTEGQNITNEIAKLLLGRIGQDSILMINADNHQTDSRIYEKDNGIVSMIEKLSGNPLFGYVYLSQTLRSDTANLANLLD